jgi:two-component system KDP operon response regulator KdpE
MALKILMIDDDPSTTVLTSLLLESYGMEVTVAHTGISGIQKVRDAAPAPDLVLLDMMMPEMDGFEVCKAIRTFSNLPILAYSAVSDPEYVARARAAGVNDYIQKPTPVEIMVARIKRLTSPGI